MKNFKTKMALGVLLVLLSYPTAKASVGMTTGWGITRDGWCVCSKWNSEGFEMERISATWCERTSPSHYDWSGDRCFKYCPNGYPYEQVDQTWCNGSRAELSDFMKHMNEALFPSN